MGKYYKELDMFLRDIRERIQHANMTGFAVSVAIYIHGKGHNPPPKVDRDIGDRGTCYHFNFHEAHK